MNDLVRRWKEGGGGGGRRRSVGGERAREMAIGAGGDGSADNSSVARRRPVLRVAIRPCAELAFLLRPPLLPSSSPLSSSFPGVIGKFCFSLFPRF